MNNNQLTSFQNSCLHQGLEWLGLDADEQQVFIDKLLLADLEERELLICSISPVYFIMLYIKIYDAQAKDWIPFTLWGEQLEVLLLFHLRQLTIALKARQLGLTWLALAYALWQMLFRPIATIMLFSRREEESSYLLSDERLRGMYKKLPDWMKTKGTAIDAVHRWKLSNGSVAYAFPTTAGDSYTASMVICDEADLIPDLNRLMSSVKPTIDAGGKFIMISRSNKREPNSEFKRIYRGAKAAINNWAAIFLPWWVRPDRDDAWYEAKSADILARTGGLDELHEQYPSTDTEALAPASLHKRIPREWAEQCYVEMPPMPIDDLPPEAPSIPGLKVFKLPEKFAKYAGGVDCAEGLPTSDDSAATFIDVKSGEEVCNLVGKLTPAVQAAYCAQISKWYNKAGLMVERNNHGHATIGWLDNNGHSGLVLNGHDTRPGWLSSTLGKVLMYDSGAEAFKNGETNIHDYETLTQLMSIEKGTLRAPEGEMDDRADSYVLALMGRYEVLQAGDSIGYMQAEVKW
jgi:hypothetical protein